jgi:dTDP-4-dehydrorhamnose 3,5-epimerase
LVVAATRNICKTWRLQLREKSMTITTKNLAIPDIKLITPKAHIDRRGSFCETWNQRDLEHAGVYCNVVQDNHVVSNSAGTLRGLHFQSEPYAQGKLIRVTKGRIFDVAVDLRPGSATFGQWVGQEIDCHGGEQLWIPPGFAHGYCTLEPQTEVIYKVDNYYNPSAEDGIRWDDPDLGLAWPVPGVGPVVSSKDRALPTYADWQSKAAHGLDHRNTDDYDDQTNSRQNNRQSEHLTL